CWRSCRLAKWGDRAMGATAILAISTAGSAYGQHQAGAANRTINRYNARIAELQAEDAQERGRDAEGRVRVQTRQTIGAQRAALAAQGIDIGDGTAAAIQEDTAYFGELDALTVRNNAALEAFGYRVQGADAWLRGDLAYMEGRN